MGNSQRTLGKVLWWNGKFMPPEQAQTSLFTHTLHYGLGAFEGIRAYRTHDGKRAIFRLQEHVDRLFDSCKIVDLKIPYDKAAITQAIKDTVAQSGLEECYIRPLVFIGDGPLGVFPTFDPPVEVAVMTWVWGAYLGAEAKAKGARIKVASFARPHINTQMSKGKIVGHYVNSILAKMEAKKAGCDEALLLDTEGYVAEGSGENFFLYRHGALKTTPIPGVLEGITRDSILQIARDEGVEVRETRFTRDEVYTASEAFFCGTAAEVTPVRELDGRQISDGMGPITKRINDAYVAAVRGQNPKYAKWLTYV